MPGILLAYNLLQKISRWFLFLGIFLVLSLQIPNDPDLGINLEVGRFILRTHTIPRSDLFSFALPNHPYVYHSWLGQVVLSAVYDGGIRGLSVISVIWSVWCAATIVILYRLCRPSLWLFLLFLLSTTHIFSSIGVRPQMFSFTFLVVEMGVLLSWRRSKRDPTSLKELGGASKGPKNFFEIFQGKGASYLLWLLVPLFWVWANAHPGFIIGLLVMVIFIVLKMGKAADWSAWKQVIMPLICSLLITFINPFGLDLYKQAWMIATNPFNLSQNLEWVPLFARGGTHIVFILTCILLFLFYLHKKPIDWTLLVTSILLFLLSLKSTRTTLFFLVVFFPMISSMLAALPNPVKNLWPFRWERLPIYLALITLGFSLFARGYENIQRLSQALSSEKILAKRMGYPYDAALYLKDHLYPARVFNDFNWGGYLVWQMPGRRVFATSIMDTFQTDGKYFLEDYFSLREAKNGWLSLLDGYQLDGVLLSPTTPLVQTLRKHSDWQVIFEDQSSVLLQKAPLAK